MKRSKWKAFMLLVALVANGALLACDSQNEQTVGPICASCGPSSGGETGDFGGSLANCEEHLVEAELAEVEAVGLSLSELESRLARPIDESMRWDTWDEGNPMRRPLSATGYEERTRITGEITLTSPFRYLRFDGCEDGLCHTCASQIWVDVSIALRTEDDAVQATTSGTVVHTLKNPLSESQTRWTYFNTDTDLRNVVGTLRFSGPDGAAYHGRLGFSASIEEDHHHGNLSLFVDVEEGERRPELPALSGQYFFPLYGSFPGRP